MNLLIEAHLLSRMGLGNRVINPELSGGSRQSNILILAPIELGQKIFSLAALKMSVLSVLPQDWALAQTDNLAEYLYNRFLFHIDLDRQVGPIPPCIALSVSMSAECEHAAHILALAYKNTGDQQFSS